AGGGYLQLDDRHNMYEVTSIENGVINFINPPFVLSEDGTPLVLKEGDLRVDSRTTTARFRLYRKPTKSFLQTLTLPRGTCIDLSSSGLGTTGNEFRVPVPPPTPLALAMIVFNPQGRIAY